MKKSSAIITTVILVFILIGIVVVGFLTEWFNFGQTPTSSPPPSASASSTPEPDPGPEPTNYAADAFTVFDLSNKQDIYIVLSDVTSVSSLKIGGKTVGADNYSFSGNTLTIKKEGLSNIEKGYKSILINYQYLEHRIFVVNKVINNVWDLQSINNDILSGNHTGCYILGKDIDCYGSAGIFFQPIGYMNVEGHYSGLLGTDAPFMGIFEGAGYKIHNLKIDAMQCTDPRQKYTDENTANMGIGMALFSYVSGKTAVIRNFSLEDADIRGTMMMGSIVAVMDNGLAENIFVGSDVKVRASWLNKELELNFFSGGFASIVGGTALIRNCVVRAQVSLGGNFGHTHIRAFCGKLFGKIENCYADNAVFIDNPIEGYVDPNDIAQVPSTVFAGWKVDSKYEWICIYLEDTLNGFLYYNYDNNNPSHPIGKTGNATNSGMKAENELKNSDLYGEYDEIVWNITDSGMPRLKQFMGFTPAPDADPPTYSGTKTFIFDKENPADVIISGIGGITEIKHLIAGGNTVRADDYQFAEGTLSINESVFTNGDSGESQLVINGMPVPITDLKIFVVDKIIMDKSDLQSINENLSGSYILGDDINCGGSYFEPIGYLETIIGTETYPAEPFRGIFDGAGYKIHNINIDYRYCTDPRHNTSGKPGSKFNDNGIGMALFSNVGNSGVIRNFSVDDMNLFGMYNIAPVVALLDGIAENIYVGSNVIVENRGWWTESLANDRKWWCDFDLFIAGFVGQVGGNATVRNCITQAKAYFGSATHDTAPSECNSSNKNTGRNDKSNLLRAFAGKVWGTIENCYADRTSYSFNFNIGIYDQGRPRPADQNATLDPNCWKDCTFAGWIGEYGPAYVSITDEDLRGGFSYSAYISITPGGGPLSTASGTGDIPARISNSGMKTTAQLADEELYMQYDPMYWNITNGLIPTLKTLY